MLVNTRTLFDTHRELLGLECTKGGNRGEQLRRGPIDIDLLEAPHTVKKAMVAFTTRFHQAGVCFWCWVEVVFGILIERPEVTNLTSDKTSLFVNNEHWRTYTRRFLS